MTQSPDAPPASDPTSTAPTLDADDWTAKDPEIVAALERRLIDAVSKARRTDTPDKWLGLALSGGGIRSASFALGVLQSLHNWELFRRIDYLSTVSGGGYIGASLTYFLQYKEMGAAGEFPFGRRRQAGARSVTLVRGDVDPKALPDPKAIVSFIRQHAHYLTPKRELNWFAFFATALRAVFTSLAVYFPLLLATMVVVVTGAFLLARWGWLTDRLEKLDCAADVFLFPTYPGDFCSTAAGARLDWVNWPVATVAIVFAISILNALVFAWRTSGDRGQQDKRDRIYPKIAINNAIFNGRLLMAFIVVATLSVLPWVIYLLGDLWKVIATGGVSATLGYVGTLIDFRSRLKGLAAGGSWFSQARPIVFAVLAVFGLLVLSFGLAEGLVSWKGAATPLWFGPACFLVLVLASLWINSFCNLNYVSQHRMYRDRLMEAFCPPNAAIERQAWKPSVAADTLAISACRPRSSDHPAALPGPYHLINTALVIPGSKKTRYRGRGGDNFIISPLACGSDATGWRCSKAYMTDGITLPTAMAISGAALNAHSGGGQRAATRDSVLSFLITLFGAQLGYWAQHPQAEAQVAKPSFLDPGWRGLLGVELDEDPARRFVQLADGGHYENLGIYELLRRRLDVIVVSDAGQDKDFGFEDLGIAIERARVDFGVGIEFTLDDYVLEGLLPGSDKSADVWTKEFRLAARGFAIARIHYPEPERKLGYLVIIKATLIAGLPADLYAYRRLNPDFPNQTTVDQDFDEYQFEAYRELGYRLTNQFFLDLFGEADNQAITLRVLLAALDNRANGVSKA